MGVAITTRKFTVDEYHTMIQTGVLREDDRVELLAGGIVEMSPISSKHGGCLKRLVELFSVLLAEKKIQLGVQDPVQLNPLSEPQPDLTLLKYRENAYSDRHPIPEDIHLLIEISESSLSVDRDVKLPLYARAKIQEVWIINLLDERLERYLNPETAGYRRVQTYVSGDEISPQVFPEFRLAVKDILLK